MKTHTFTTKTTLFCKLLLLVLAALLLVSCNQAGKTPEDTTEQTEESSGQNEETKSQYKHNIVPLDKDLLLESTTIAPNKLSHDYVFYYGTYNDCIVTGLWIQIDTPGTLEVAGFTFEFIRRTHMSVWKNGEEFSLQEAYDQGLLTKDQIRILYEINEEKSFIVYYDDIVCYWGGIEV